MILKSGNTEAVKLDKAVFKTLLGFYPEEKLTEYGVFKGAIEKGSITIAELKSGSEKIHVPWQMFLLNMTNLIRELKNIEDNRSDKFPKSLLDIHKRKGAGNITSKRIIDRQIRVQSFISTQLPENFSCDFAGSLQKTNIQESTAHTLEYFQIDINYFRTRKTVEDSKNYLIERIQSKNNINVSQGVRTNGILPEVKNTLEVFRNTSGFVVRDKKIPFIFLPSEINPDENHYRQIYTLIYLVVVVGMGEYTHAIENQSIKKVQEDKKYKKINDIVSEILLPQSVTANLKTEDINKDLINKLKEEYRLSYTAILFIFRFRKKIDSDTHKLLKLPKKEPNALIENAKNFFTHPLITTSVQQFCGRVASERINAAIRGGLFPNQAQMLIFGRFRKDKWIEFRSRI